MTTHTTLDTMPREVEVTTDSAGTWKVTFTAAAAATGATSIASCSAAVSTDMPADNGTAVDGFVVSATPDDLSVVVAWTGVPLRRGMTYRLETRAVFNNGTTPEFITRVKCVA